MSEFEQSLKPWDPIGGGVSPATGISLTSELNAGKEGVVRLKGENLSIKNTKNIKFIENDNPEASYWYDSKNNILISCKPYKNNSTRRGIEYKKKFFYIGDIHGKIDDAPIPEVHCLYATKKIVFCAAKFSSTNLITLYAQHYDELLDGKTLYRKIFSADFEGTTSEGYFKNVRYKWFSQNDDTEEIIQVSQLLDSEELNAPGEVLIPAFSYDGDFLKFGFPAKIVGKDFNVEKKYYTLSIPLTIDFTVNKDLSKPRYATITAGVVTKTTSTSKLFYNVTDDNDTESQNYGWVPRVFPYEITPVPYTGDVPPIFPYEHLIDQSYPGFLTPLTSWKSSIEITPSLMLLPSGVYYSPVGASLIKPANIIGTTFAPVIGQSAILAHLAERCANASIPPPPENITNWKSGPPPNGNGILYRRERSNPVGENITFLQNDSPTSYNTYGNGIYYKGPSGFEQAERLLEVSVALSDHDSIYPTQYYSSFSNTFRPPFLDRIIATATSTFCIYQQHVVYNGTDYVEDWWLDSFSGFWFRYTYGSYDWIWEASENGSVKQDILATRCMGKFEISDLTGSDLHTENRDLEGEILKGFILDIGTKTVVPLKIEKEQVGLNTITTTRTGASYTYELFNHIRDYIHTNKYTAYTNEISGAIDPLRQQTVISANQGIFDAVPQRPENVSGSTITSAIPFKTFLKTGLKKLAPVSDLLTATDIDEGTTTSTYSFTVNENQLASTIETDQFGGSGSENNQSSSSGSITSYTIGNLSTAYQTASCSYTKSTPLTTSGNTIIREFVFNGNIIKTVSNPNKYLYNIFHKPITPLDKKGSVLFASLGWSYAGSGGTLTETHIENNVLVFSSHTAATYLNLFPLWNKVTENETIFNITSISKSYSGQFSTFNTSYPVHIKFTPLILK